jgi:putative MATE family efflux protein
MSSENIEPLPYAHKGNLVSGPVFGHLVRLSVPMIWGIFAIISFQLVDTFYVSLLGTKPLAALSFTFPLNYAIFSLTMGFSIAMSSVVSRLIGAGREEDVKRVTTHGLMMVFLLGIAVSIMGVIFHDRIFELMGADPEILPLIRDYMILWFLGVIFVAVPMVGNAALRAAGDSLTPSVIMTVAAVVNLVLDPIMIFGLFGFPRMEIVGASLSTVFANACAMLASLYVLAIRRKMLLPLNDLHMHLFGDSARRILFIALPAGLTNAIQPIAGAFIVSLLAAYGPEAVAAFGVASRVEAFAFIILMAVSVGMAPVIGQNWGAGNYGRVHETLRLAIGFGAAWSMFIALVLGLFAGPIARIFSQDPAVVEITRLFFVSVPFSYVFGNLVMGWASAYNAMGRPQWSFAMIALKMIVLLIPAVILGARYAETAGIFWAIAIVNTVSGIAFHFISIQGCKRAELAGETA